MLRNTLLLLALVVSRATSSEDDHAGHDHGSAKKAWEWVGVFDFHEYSTANFVLSVKEGKTYPEKTVDILTLATKTADAAGIEAVEAEAEHTFENASTFINVGAYEDKIISPNTVHRLTLGSGPISSYRLGNFKEDANHKANYALFVQHSPAEFEGLSGHYLKSNKGKDIEPSATEPATKAKVSTSEHAGQAIGAAIIVTLLGAIGLVVVYPCWSGLGKNKNCVLFANDIAQCFASGALLSASFFLIFPEAMSHLKKAHPTSDVLQIVGFGSTTLTGIVVSMIISMISSKYGTSSTNTASKEKNLELTDVENVDKNVDEIKDDVAHNSLPNRPFCQCHMSEWTSAAWTVLFGDFFHNVADGIAIGVAFRSCDPAFGWVVAIGAIGHEVTQEMADFCLLISRGNMSVGAAVTANLLSGVSCIIGAVVASYVEMSEEAIGGLLAFSGGVYLWAAMCECVAPLVKETKGWSVILIRISMFVVGAVCIGLVLLNHVHCEAKTAPIQPAKVDSHAGHNH